MNWKQTSQFRGGRVSEKREIGDGPKYLVSSSISPPSLSLREMSLLTAAGSGPGNFGSRCNICFNVASALPSRAEEGSEHGDDTGREISGHGEEERGGGARSGLADRAHCVCLGNGVSFGTAPAQSQVMWKKGCGRGNVGWTWYDGTTRDCSGLRLCPGPSNCPTWGGVGINGYLSRSGLIGMLPRKRFAREPENRHLGGNPGRDQKKRQSGPGRVEAAASSAPSTRAGGSKSRTV
jgi:hypothetical protein